VGKEDISNVEQTFSFVVIHRSSIKEC